MFFFKQKTAYEMRISDWSSDVCSSDLVAMSLEICRSALVIEIGKLSVADFLEVSEPGDTIGPMVIISTFTTTGRCPTKPLFCGCRLSLLTGHNLADHGQGFRCVGTGYGVQHHLRSEDAPVGKECVRTCRSL